MLLSQWWELEETAIRCELGMWGRKWQAKKKTKKGITNIFAFFFVLLYSLTCSPAVHHFTSQLRRREPCTLTPQAHLRVSQGIPWAAQALGGAGPTFSWGPGRLSGVGKEAERPRRGCVLWKPLHIPALCREPRAGCSFPSEVCMKSLPSFLPSFGDFYFSEPDALAQCSICCMPNTHSFLTKAFFNCLRTASGHI